MSEEWLVTGNIPENMLAASAPTNDEIVITVGSEWQHIKKLTHYKILHLANIHGDRWPWMVVYMDEQAQVWARPIDEWVGRYEELVKGSGDF